MVLAKPTEDAAMQSLRIITLEEGFTTPGLSALGPDPNPGRKFTMRTSSEILGRDVDEASLELGEQRIAAMDAAGIDLQVLSFNGPQVPDPALSVRLMAEANEAAAEAMRRYPGRFSALAALPLADPAAAVREFDRALTQLGFVGGFVAGSINGEFLDQEKFYPVLELAEARGVPIYLHPYFPLPALMQTYFRGREELSGPEWGFMVDASSHFLRLVTAGVFDRFPKLTVLLGHLGESIPYNLDRINSRLRAWVQERKLQRTPAEYIRENLVVTTSGNFSSPSLLCALTTLGADNILFSADYPNESNLEAVDFLLHLPVARTDLEKIAHKNAERVLRLAPAS